MARVNVEERCFAEKRIAGLALEMGWSEHQAMGVMVYLWHGSQEAVRPGGGPEEIRRWAFLKKDEIEKFIVAACAFHFLEKKETKNGDYYEIVGNRAQIETRISRIKAGIKGAKSTKEKWRAARPVDAVAETGQLPGPIQFNSIQCNSDKYSSQDSSESEKENPNSEKPRNDRKDIQEFWEAYNQNRGALPKAEKLTKGRIQKIKKRLEENPSLDYWKQVVSKLAASDFVTSGSWCNIDWIISNDTNHVKAYEGKYDKKTDKPKSFVETRKMITFDDEG